MGVGALPGSTAASSPAWQGRSIATQKLRLVEFSAFVESQGEPDTYNKHLFVQIGGPVTYSDPVLEVIHYYLFKITIHNYALVMEYSSLWLLNYIIYIITLGKPLKEGGDKA